jgi:hypothetical protein
MGISILCLNKELYKFILIVVFSQKINNSYNVIYKSIIQLQSQ